MISESYLVRLEQMTSQRISHKEWIQRMGVDIHSPLLLSHLFKLITCENIQYQQKAIRIIGNLLSQNIDDSNNILEQYDIFHKLSKLCHPKTHIEILSAVAYTIIYNEAVFFPPN